jgi:hypothetical protein
VPDLRLPTATGGNLGRRADRRVPGAPAHPLRRVPDDPTAEHREEPIRFYPPEEALRRARPLPSPEELRIEDLTDEEWTRFLEAIADP